MVKHETKIFKIGLTLLLMFLSGFTLVTGKVASRGITFFEGGEALAIGIGLGVCAVISALWTILTEFR